jgi:hypothetical protein
MPTNFETIFLFDICVHIIRFLPKAYCKEISVGKSYCVTTTVHTTVPQLLKINNMLKIKKNPKAPDWVAQMSIKLIVN